MPDIGNAHRRTEITRFMHKYDGATNKHLSDVYISSIAKRRSQQDREQDSHNITSPSRKIQLESKLGLALYAHIYDRVSFRLTLDAHTRDIISAMCVERSLSRYRG